jgi:hypothetical protein
MYNYSHALEKKNTSNVLVVFLDFHIFFIQCNYCITPRVNFFLPEVKGYFRFFNLGFLRIILWG